MTMLHTALKLMTSSDDTLFFKLLHRFFLSPVVNTHACFGVHGDSANEGSNGERCPAAFKKSPK